MALAPYYQHDGITIYHGDFREIGPRLGIEFDCVIADPPYGQTSLAWDRWVREWPMDVAPLLKLTGSMWCFGSLRMFMKHAGDFIDWKFAQDIVWEKQNGSGFHADRFKRVHEQAVQFYRDDAVWSEVYFEPPTTPDATAKTVRRKKRPGHMGNIGAHRYVSEDGGPRLMRSVIFAENCHGQADNETQKPVEIVTPLLQSSCPAGGVVLAPFAGSGTDGLAARALGMRAVLIEVREQQCEIAATGLQVGVLFRSTVESPRACP